MKLDTIVRAIRVLFGTVTVVALFGVGGAVAATKFAQADLEDRAIESARRLATSSIAPVLQPRDAVGPLRGARYTSLLAVVRREVLQGPISGVKLWSDDGTVLFADERALVGKTQPAMKQTIDSIGRATAVGEVDGARFVMLVPLEVAKDGPSVTAELSRSHEAIAEQAKETWWSWVGKAGRIAVIAFVLYLATVGIGALLAAQQRRAAHAARDARPLPGSSRAPRAGRITEQAADRRGRALPALKRFRRPATRAPVEEPASSLREAISAIEPRETAALDGANDGPAYLQPSFRDLEASRRKAEDALAVSLQERARLEDRVRQLEGELSEARRRLSMADAP